MELGLFMGALAILYSTWATIQINNYQIKVRELKKENIIIKNKLLEFENSIFK